MNESGSYMAYCKGMLERNQTVPAIPSWAIMDSQFVRKYMLAGSMPGARKPASWFEQGYLRKADSLEELADMIQMDSTALDATVQRRYLPRQECSARRDQ